MEEEIKILEKKLKQWEPYKNIKFPTPIEREISKENRAIENLINKYKEQEENKKTLNQRLYEADQKLIKTTIALTDREKIIELMAEAIHDYEDWTDMVCNIVDCKNTPHCKAETKEQELDCIIDYFRKKAKGE